MPFYFRKRFMLPEDDRPSRSNLTVGRATRSHSDKAVQYLMVCADFPVAPHFGQIKAMRTGHSTSLAALRKTRRKRTIFLFEKLERKSRFFIHHATCKHELIRRWIYKTCTGVGVVDDAMTSPYLHDDWRVNEQCGFLLLSVKSLRLMNEKSVLTREKELGRQALLC